MWEYYITRWDLWYHIFREKEEDWIKKKERYQWNSYTPFKNFAKTFFHLNEATSALVLVRARWKRTPTTSIKKSGLVDGKEKRSWHEL